MIPHAEGTRPRFFLNEAGGQLISLSGMTIRPLFGGSSVFGTAGPPVAAAPCPVSVVAAMLAA
jgi:hypothetical protein